MGGRLSCHGDTSGRQGRAKGHVPRNNLGVNRGGDTQGQVAAPGGQLWKGVAALLRGAAQPGLRGTWGHAWLSSRQRRAKEDMGDGPPGNRMQKGDIWRGNKERRGNMQDTPKGRAAAPIAHSGGSGRITSSSSSCPRHCRCPYLSSPSSPSSAGPSQCSLGQAKPSNLCQNTWCHHL